MKPRIEKKLSKRLVEAFAGLRLFHGVWTNYEWEREDHYAWPDKPPLTSKQVRENRDNRVSVNGILSVGGELDYFGEPTDVQTVHAYYRDKVYCELAYTDELCTIDCVLEEDRTPHQEARRKELLLQARRQYRRIRTGNNLLTHAHREAAQLRHVAAEEAKQRLASKSGVFA